MLVSRLLTVGPAILVLRRFRGANRQVPAGTIRILVWGGLRGGVSVALALSLPLGPERDLILSLTYIVVLVSILLQGLSIGPLVRRIYAGQPLEKSEGRTERSLRKRAPAVMAGVFVGGHQALSCGASLRWVPRRFIAARQTCSRISA